MCVLPIPGDVSFTTMIPLSIKYCSPSTKDASSILSSHQKDATFFTQLGITSSGGLTVTKNVTGWASFPAESLALHITWDFPIEKNDPDVGAQDGSTSSSVSSIAKTSKTTRAPLLFTALVSMSEGVRIIGLTSSMVPSDTGASPPLSATCNDRSETQTARQA